MKLSSITSFVVALTLTMPIMAQQPENPLNLSEEQQQQLKQFKEKRKLELQQFREEQMVSDRRALSEFLSEEQIQQIMQRKSAKKGPRRWMVDRLIKQRDVLNLTENQIIQLQEITPVVDSSLDKKNQRKQIKQTIKSILSEQQLERLSQLRSGKSQQ